MYRSSSNSIPYLMGTTVLLIIIYIVLGFMKIQAGTLIDWIVGIVAFWWLTGITTLPWDMYFTAKDLLHEAKISENKEITLDQEDIAYTKRQASLFIKIAVILHLVTAVALYLLAFFGISSIGYFAAGLAIVLTFVRPAYRVYDFIIERLRSIHRKILYPREDVYELRNAINIQTERIDALVAALDLEQEESWASKIAHELKKVSAHSKQLEQTVEKLSADNDKAHASLATQTQQEISKLSEDAQFLNQAREVIRFFKNA